MSNGSFWKTFAVPIVVFILAFFFGEWYFSWIMPAWLALDVTILFTLLVFAQYLVGGAGAAEKIVHAFFEYTLPFSIMPLGAIALAYVPLPGISHLPLDQRLLFTTALSPVLVAFVSLLWSSFSRLQQISRDAGGYMTVLVVIYSLYSCFDHPTLVVGLTMISSAIALMISSRVISPGDPTILKVFRASIVFLIAFGLILSIFGAFSIKSTLIKMEGVNHDSISTVSPDNKQAVTESYPDKTLDAQKKNVFSGGEKHEPKQPGGLSIMPNRDLTENASQRHAVDDFNQAVSDSQNQAGADNMSIDVNSPAQIAMQAQPDKIASLAKQFVDSPRNQGIKKMTLDQFAGDEDKGGAALFTPPDIGGYLTTMSTIDRGFADMGNSNLNTLDIPATAWACMYSGIAAEKGRSDTSSQNNYKYCGYVRNQLKASKPTDDKNLVQIPKQKPVLSTLSTKDAANAWSSASKISKPAAPASSVMPNQTPTAASW